VAVSRWRLRRLWCGLLLVVRATAPADGAMTSQSPMMATIAVMQPNGLIPEGTAPTKIISSYPLMKDSAPAAGSAR
jgi:hypothetical protein